MILNDSYMKSEECYEQGDILLQRHPEISSYWKRLEQFPLHNELSTLFDSCFPEPRSHREVSFFHTFTLLYDCVRYIF